VRGGREQRQDAVRLAQRDLVLGLALLRVRARVRVRVRIRVRED